MEWVWKDKQPVVRPPPVGQIRVNRKKNALGEVGTPRYSQMILKARIMA